ncbi:MAG: hypothetical protein H0U67_05290 [Gemmatimonadetes bacterium]|nr:hypothetical protein [Gemmatimonadota bacterium]
MRRLALSLLAGAALAGVVSSGEAQAAAEAREEWTLVDSLPIALGTIPWETSVALRADTIYAAANIVSADSGRSVRGRSLALHRRPGAPMPLPPGDFMFAFAHGVIDRQGSYHLFWGESSDTIENPHPGPNYDVATLWHSVYSVGGWSKPAVVFSARRISWAGEPATITLDDRGRLHLAAPAWDSISSSRVIHARRDSGGWSITHIPGITAAYVTLLPGRSDTVSMVVSGAYRDFPSVFPHFQRNRLGILHSFNAGRSWGAPVLLEGLTSLEVYDLHGSVDGTGAMHLLWKGISDSSVVARVERFVSRDRGTNWSLAESLEFDGMMRLHQFAVGRCGVQMAATVMRDEYPALFSRPVVSSRHLRDRLSVRSAAVAAEGASVVLSVLAFGPGVGDHSWLLLKRNGCAVDGVR